MQLAFSGVAFARRAPRGSVATCVGGLRAAHHSVSVLRNGMRQTSSVFTFRSYSTWLNKHYVHYRNMRLENGPPTDLELELKELEDLGRTTYNLDDLIREKPEYVLRIMKLCASDDNTVKNSAIKLLVALPDALLSKYFEHLATQDRLDQIFHQIIGRDELDSVLEAIFEFCTHPSRPLAKLKALELHVHIATIIENHFAEKESLIGVYHRLATICALEGYPDQTGVFLQKSCALILQNVHTENNSSDFDPVNAQRARILVDALRHQEKTHQQLDSKLETTAWHLLSLIGTNSPFFTESQRLSKLLADLKKRLPD